MKFVKLKKLIAVAIASLSITAVSSISASASWKQNSYGWWNTKGNSYSIGWENIGNCWYYFGQDGYMKNGWINSYNTWYYMDNSGAMKTGWVNDNGTWYYMDNSGAMKTGWVNSYNTWYYMDMSGAMKTGLITLNNKMYYLDENGAMKTGDLTINGIKYSFSSNGEGVIKNSTADNKESQNNQNTENNEETEEKSTSGGGGGSSSSTEKTDELSTNSSYSDLKGTWTIDEHVDSKMKSTIKKDLIPLAIGEDFTVESNKIKSLVSTLNNPRVKEKKLSADNFEDKYGDTLENIGLDGDNVKIITVTDRSKTSHTVDVVVSDNGDVVAITKGTVFKLSKQN